MSNTKNSLTKSEIENEYLLEELRKSELTDDEFDAYFDDSKPLKIDGVVDALSLISSARLWHTRKLKIFAIMKSKDKALTSLRAIKMLADDENAKELANLWCIKNPDPAEIQSFLKKHPVDSAWYFIAILANIEITERAKAKAVRVRNARSGGKAKPNPLDEFMPMIFEHWLKWQEDPSLFESNKKFAEEMHYESDDVVSEETIKRWCTHWKKIRLLQIKNASA
jgi:hypothetical protein